MRVQWFPVTIKRPSTAFAFDILDFFHKLQNQNKCNLYNFYHAIIQRTDAAGVNPEIVWCSLFGFFILTHKFPSITTTRLPSSFVSGVIYSFLSKVVLCTTLPLPTHCLMEAWQLYVPLAPNRGRTLLLSHSPNCTNNLSYRVVCCTHQSLLL